MRRSYAVLIILLIVAAVAAVTYGYRYATLSRQYRDLAAQMGAAEKQTEAMAAVREELASTQQELAASRLAEEELKAELGSAREEFERQVAALQASAGELEASQLEIQQLSAERDLLKTGLDLFRERMGEVLGRLRSVQENMETKISSLVAERDELAKAVEEREEEIKGLLLERTEELSKHELAREELSRTLEVLEGMRGNTEIVRNEILWVGREISQGLAERQKLAAAAEEADKYLRKWAGDFARMGEKYVELLAGVRRLHEERDRLAAAVREQEGRLREYQGDEQFRISERERARREIERTVAAVEELKGHFGNIRNEMLILETRAAESLAEKKELADVVRETRSSLRKWVDEFEDIGERYEAVRVQVYRSEQERARLAEALASLEEEIAVLQTARAQLEDSEVEARRRLAEMAEDIRRSEQERKDLALLVKRLEELAEEKSEELNKLRLAYSELVAKLRSELAEKDVEIVGMRDRLTVRVLDKVLFDLGSTRIKREGTEVLDRLLPILKEVQDGLIVVEGHTDSIPIKKPYRRLFPTNWELSTARATRVVRYLEERGIDPKNMAAVGYAFHRPLLSNETEEGRKRNRRIEIVVYPAARDRVQSGM